MVKTKQQVLVEYLQENTPTSLKLDAESRFSNYMNSSNTSEESKVIPDGRGMILAVSGFSGSGKSSVIKRLLSANESLAYPISYVTRPMREGESQGNPYHFICKDDFYSRLDSGSFLETETIHGNFYGSELSAFEELLLSEGKDVIKDVGVGGFIKLRALYGERVVGIFLTPQFKSSKPVIETIKNRLIKRGDKLNDIQVRLNSVYYESLFIPFYEHFLINGDLSLTVERIQEIYTTKKELLR